MATTVMKAGSEENASPQARASARLAVRLELLARELGIRGDDPGAVVVEHGVLAGKVVVEGAEADLGPVEDVLYPGLVKAPLAEQADRGIHDRFALALLLAFS
jgi:hypothetical protein